MCTLAISYRVLPLTYVGVSGVDVDNPSNDSVAPVTQLNVMLLVHT